MNASRSVTYAFRDGEEDWRGAAAAEAARSERRGVGRLRLVSRRADRRPLAIAAGRVPAGGDRGRARAVRSGGCAPDRAVRRPRDGRHDDGGADGERAPSRATAAVAAPRRYYVIASGDTLGAIAGDFATTVDALLRLNPGIEPTALTPGEQLRIRSGGCVVAFAAVKLRLALLATALLLSAQAAIAGAPQVDGRAYLVQNGVTGEVLAQSHAARAACRWPASPS